MLRYSRSLLLFSFCTLWLLPSELQAEASVLFQQKRTTSSSPRRTATPPASAKVTAASSKAATTVLKPTSPVGEEALASDLQGMLNGKTRNGEWSALVVSLSKGDTLLAYEADRPMVPASTMKLFTSVLAFEELGPDHTLSTDVLRDGPLGPDGVLHGNLILRGDGDPALSPKFVKGGAEAPMQLLAQLVAGAGVKRVEGDLIADATGMEGRRIPEGWLTRYSGAAYAAPFSALSLNENIVIVGVYPEKGSRVSVRLEPESSGLQVVSSVRAVAGRATKVTVRMVGESQVTVTGTIGVNAKPHRVQLVVSDPVTFAAGAFREALQKNGIEVTGNVRSGRTPEGVLTVTSMKSPPVSRLVSVMNRESSNHYAEQLYRTAARGVDRTGQGSAENAFSVLSELALNRIGIPKDHITATDGSGLSVLNRVSARSLVQLMDYAHRAPWAGVFHASLPVAGESETLKTRMRNSAAQGNLHAKTGTTNDVISLAGYVTAENGEILSFAFLYNGSDRWNARETIDAMGPTLAAFSR